MEPPRVDVIVPVLDGGADLAACLATLMAQSDVVARVIVADNGSRDGSCATALASGAVLVHETARSSYAARNRALQEASASWIAFTDADCLPAQDWLVRAVAHLERTGDDLCGGRIESLPSTTLPGRRDALCYLDQRAFVRGGFAATANLVVRAEVVRAVGGFDAARTSGGDVDFCIRARQQGFRLGYADDALVRHRPRESWGGMVRKAWRVSTAHGTMIARGELGWRSWMLGRAMYVPPKPVRDAGALLVLTDLVARATEALGRLYGLARTGAQALAAR